MSYSSENSNNQSSQPQSEKAVDTSEKKKSLWDINSDGYHEVVDHGKTKIELGAKVGLGFFKVNRSQYGAGSRDLKNTNIIRHSPFWTEAFLTPMARVTQGLENGSALYGRLSGVAAKTWGQGDAINPSSTSNKPFLLDHEEAVIGWKTGTFTTKEDLLDFSYGNQSVVIGDGFVLGDGTNDSYRRAAQFLGPRKAFRNTFMVKVNTQPLRAQLFHLGSNTNQRYLRGTDQPKTFLYGGNFEYVATDAKDEKKELWTIGAMIFHIYRADRTINTGQSSNRQGLTVYNPRIGGTFFPQNRDIRFFAGYVHQKNNRHDRKTNANAYYIEPGYTFSKLWGAPLLFYRFSHFSGDAAPENSIKKSYDPMMFAFVTRDGWGTWESGQIQDNFYYTNTNKNVHSVQLKFTPSEQCNFGAQYFNIRFDKIQQQPGALSKRAAEEIDAYVAWTPNQRMSYTLLAGIVKPKAGIRQATIQAAIEANPNTAPSNIGKKTFFGALMASFKL